MHTTFSLDKIVEWDKELLLYLNAKHVDWLDPVMLFLSSQITWAVVCILIIGFMIYKKRKIGVWTSIFLVASLVMNSVLNNLVKITVERPRPIHEEAFASVIHAIEGYDSSFSFFSAHSSNSFCLAIFSSLIMRSRYYTILVVLWATLVAYSRIYLAKHYPGDVLIGIAFGVFMGMLGYRMYRVFAAKKLVPKLDS